MSEGRLADRAYTGIVEMINADGLAVGDRLPSEARLAEIFGMSRTVVREALVRLAADSITEARRGAGSFVKNRPSDKLSAYMPLSELPSTWAATRCASCSRPKRRGWRRRGARPRRWPASRRRSRICAPRCCPTRRPTSRTWNCIAASCWPPPIPPF
jgi:DNA-binding transcriptional MocR family regulator